MGDLVLSNVEERKWNSGLLVKFLLIEKLINEKLTFRNNIPIFHHSNIPCARRKLKPQNITLFSISCKISDTYN